MFVYIVCATRYRIPTVLYRRLLYVRTCPINYITARELRFRAWLRRVSRCAAGAAPARAEVRSAPTRRRSGRVGPRSRLRRPPDRRRPGDVRRGGAWAAEVRVWCGFTCLLDELPDVLLRCSFIPAETYVRFTSHARAEARTYLCRRRRALRAGCLRYSAPVLAAPRRLSPSPHALLDLKASPGARRMRFAKLV